MDNKIESAPNNTPPWLLKRVDTAASTNDLAKALAPWQAVAARRQEAGRGRHGRKFASGEGGIWISAVLPMPGGAQRWTGLALAVGWGLLGWLRSLPGGVPGARLRWPNDLMVGRRKLGGILLEQSAPDRCVAGVGINVFNDPAQEDPSLGGIAARLADCVRPGALPGWDALLAGLLDGVARGWAAMEREGLAGIHEEINACWGGATAVEVHPDCGEPVCGTMAGIDRDGSVIVRLPGGGWRSFSAHHIRRLVEIDP